MNDRQKAVITVAGEIAEKAGMLIRSFALERIINPDHYLTAMMLLEGARLGLDYPELAEQITREWNLDRRLSDELAQSLMSALDDLRKEDE